ncbi:MAG: phytoene desaturase family protein [Steroidobacterales bacterium]
MSTATAATRHDCIVIGAGHNGLVCATLLARAGRKVLVLEASAQVGGAAVTRMFHPQFRVSAGAHLLHLMPAQLLGELRLDSHGLHMAAQQLPSTALSLDGAALPLGADLTGADAGAHGAYAARMRRFGAALAPILAGVAPRLGTDRWEDRLGLLRAGWQLRKLGRTDMRELLRIGGMNVYDLLKEHFSSPLLQGALGLDAVLGTNFGPRSPGTVLTLLYRLALESAAGDGGLALPQGGMGAVCDALAKAAQAAGATVRTEAPVERILVDDDRASGVRLESGEEFTAGCVISNADPKTTFLDLLGSRYLDTGFVRRVTHLRSKGLTAKLHLALSALPRFTGVPDERVRGRLLIAPSLEHIEQAYNHAKYGEFSAAPVMEITVPSVSDPAFAPAGQHVLSAIVQYAPYSLKGGWDSQRQAFTDLAIATLERHAPGLKDTVIGAELLTPADIEREFRINGGHWHHADLAFDQFLMVRPVPGATQHRTPLAGLYLCGAGCHPGGGVMGIAGRNAASQVLRQVK